MKKTQCNEKRKDNTVGDTYIYIYMYIIYNDGDTTIINTLSVNKEHDINEFYLINKVQLVTFLVCYTDLSKT